MTFFNTPEPSAYPESWEVDGQGGEYCGECGCDFPREAASHAMACEYGQELAADEWEAFTYEQDHWDTIAEQTGLDR